MSHAADALSRFTQSSGEGLQPSSPEPSQTAGASEFGQLIRLLEDKLAKGSDEADISPFGGRHARAGEKLPQACRNVATTPARCAAFAYSARFQLFYSEEVYNATKDVGLGSAIAEEEE
ncbi:hypothetical protein CDV31_001575 [Fusarium ambrosium]|uniref:Uncharacterized protein n=1 Tax=Fusarium ambrosium TaxID=131363 RepID=A0A428UZF4_9HYPO|nr:hypothetical protein CDV31_001575 [Fusarium ambrosium]